jgi:peptidoglycan/LPS O-acetylase OafA/YrhL
MVNTQIGSWTIATDHNLITPLLVSNTCSISLSNFFQNGSSQLLAETAEAQSHPSGLNSLFAQPWVWASGGLGNIDECPLQVCLAGGTLRDSLVFASACVVPECTAFDLAADDFPASIERSSQGASNFEDQSVITGYISSFRRLGEINEFLKTGWVCGEYKADWSIGSTLYLCVVCVLLLLSCIGTFAKRSARKQLEYYNRLQREEVCIEEKKEELAPIIDNNNNNNNNIKDESMPENQFWAAWDMSAHLKKLCTRRPETACLDGLKFGSIVWVMLGHIVAIQSSTGPGYLNPSKVLPPHGFTTTLGGQLVFSSRFAVDTFLCISGYLVVHILKRKLSRSPSLWDILSLLALRILRILPLYGMCLGFWMFVAPHLGSGPFWYQWQFYLEPCKNYWWTNFLFVNNFLPWEKPTTDSCFYHSWYLALDVQLFFLFGPWLVLLYLKSHKLGRRATAFLWCLSVVITAFLSYTRKWSANTLDGRSAVLFDIEGYAKPHVRCQSYLAGMFVAMMPHARNRVHSKTRSMLLALFGLATMSLITVTGAYSRRACQFQELPSTSDCGSSWSPLTTFFYTAFGRAIWSICIAIVMRLCLERQGGMVGSILSWSIWTPLAHLSFGVYLIHPMIIFIWKLGDRQKMTFRVLSYLMDFTSISVVSFVFSLVAALLVEFPFCALLRPMTTRSKKVNDENPSLIPSIESIPLQYQNSYGTRTDEGR